MKKTSRSNSNPLTRSWREIRQNANRKVVTSHARKKLLKGVLSSGLALTALAMVGAGAYLVVQHWQQGVTKMNTVLPAQPLREITFSTDGVLPRVWLEQVLDLPVEVDITSIDIHEKKALLESHGQIKSAVVRRMPDRLVIDIQERFPVARLRVAAEGGGVAVLLVDREGCVYLGNGYDGRDLSTLPFLDGVRLQRSRHGFRPLAGIDQVDDLLQIARSHAPHLVRSWEVIDCRDLPLIRVRSKEIREIVFGPDRHIEQLRWLDMIVESNRRQMMGMQERVDLSLGNQVVVR